MTIRSPLVVAAVVCATAGSSVAHAKPSIWARAANPQLAREADAADAADETISRDFSLSRLNSKFRRAALLRSALATMRAVKARTTTDVRLRYRLAQLHYRLYDVDSDLDHIETAATHYEFVASAPEVPRSQRARALMSLAICYARLGKHADEIRAYNHAVALQPDPVSHAVLLANQAEGFMARGHIIAAVRGYRASLRATPTPLMLDSGVTTMWGLGVALDRSGDLDGALKNVRRARSYDPNDERINGEHWFYVPAYDKHWYEALGHWQIARDAKDPDVKRNAYDGAIGSWRRYLERARANDPWLRIADVRLAQCAEERSEAMERIELRRPTQRKKRERVPFDPSF